MLISVEFTKGIKISFTPVAAVSRAYNNENIFTEKTLINDAFNLNVIYIGTNYLIFISKLQCKHSRYTIHLYFSSV